MKVTNQIIEKHGLKPEEFEKIAGQNKDEDKLNQQDKKSKSMIRALLNTLFGN